MKDKYYFLTILGYLGFFWDNSIYIFTNRISNNTRCVWKKCFKSFGI